MNVEGLCHIETRKMISLEISSSTDSHSAKIRRRDAGAMLDDSRWTSRLGARRAAILCTGMYVCNCTNIYAHVCRCARGMAFFLQRRIGMCADLCGCMCWAWATRCWKRCCQWTNLASASTPIPCNQIRMPFLSWCIIAVWSHLVVQIVVLFVYKHALTHMHRCV